MKKFLLFTIALLSSFSSIQAQCTYGQESSGNLTVTQCFPAYSSFNIGGGAYKYVNTTPGVWYYFDIVGSCTNVDENIVCINNTQYVGNGVTFQATSTQHYLGTVRNNPSWTTCSTTLRYSQRTPSASTPTRNNATTCNGGTVTFSVGGITYGTFTQFQYQWDGTGGSWSNWGTTNSYTWTAGGGTTTGRTLYVRAQITNGTCNYYTSPTNTVVYTDPTISISGGSSPVCSGGTFGTLSSSVTGGTGSQSYQWQRNINSGGWTNVGTSSTYSTGTVTTTGTYEYRCQRIANGPGCGDPYSNVLTFTVTADPTASISGGGATSGCAGLNPSTLTGSVNNAAGTDSYQWTLNGGNIGGATGTTYDPPALSAGTYTYRLVHSASGSGCNTATSNAITFTVTADPTASISGGGTTTGCAGLNPSTLTGSVNNAAGTDSYQWTLNGSNIGGATGTTYDPPALSAGTYTYRLVHSASGSSCNTATSNAITFTVSADPSVTISGGGGTSSACEGTNFNPTLLTAVGSGGTGSTSYQWQLNGVDIGGATSNTYDPPVLNVVGTYDYTVIYDRGGASCDAATSNTITFTIDEEPNVTAPASVCDNTTASVSASIGTVTVSAGSYSGTTFTPPNITPPTANQIVTITATNGTCVTTQNIQVDNNPSFTSSGAAMCEGDTRTLTSNVTGTTFSGTGVSGGVFTAPDPGGTSANYFITATNGSCSSLQLITVYDAVAITSSSADICEGDTRTFTTTGSGGTWRVDGVPTGATWTAPTPSGGATSQTYVIDYFVPGSPCPPTQNITVYANPSTAVAGADINACIGVDVVMGATALAKGVGTWTWLPSTPSYVGVSTPNDHDAVVNFGTAGTYTGVWTASSGPCLTTSTDTVIVEVNSAATSVTLVSGATVTAQEVCVESPWTYYANPAKPDEYLFGIKKNGNTFTADITITDLPGTTTYSSTGGAGPDRGTWLIGRYWNAELTSGSISSSVDIRFFLDAAEITQAQSEANAFLNSTYFASQITPLTFFKTTGTNFDPSTGLLLGDFTFTPTYLTYSAGSINSVSYIEMTGITSFSGGTGGFSINDDGSTLPVELLSFEASTVNNEYIQLDWSTATEINNDGFEVLRSTDGIDFERIAWVDGSGNSTEINNYAYNDYNVGKGVTYYYQLKQVDYDGQFEIFDVVSAKLEGKDDFFIGNLIPNPSKENNMVSVGVQSSQEELVLISVFNHVGVKVASMERRVSIGENNVQIDIAELAGGTYFMNFESAYGTETRKLVVIK